jgi:long-chain acyl-CoA synthetase
LPPRFPFDWVVDVLHEEAAVATGLIAVSHGSPDFHKLPDDQGLFSVVANGARRHPERPVLARRAGSGWSDVTSAQFYADVLALAARLLGWGVGHGDRVAVLGRTSYEWAVADFATMSIGAITVPVYPTASMEQVRHMLADSGAAYGFAETAEQAALLTEAAPRQWRRPVQLLTGAVAAGAVDKPAADEFAERSAAVAADDVATIVYTSGTTGMPKGCVLTHRNMFASAANTAKHEPALFKVENPSTLLCLPLAHIFGRTTLLGCLFAGIRTGLLSAIPELFTALPEFRPSFLVLVPYALEKIRKQCRALTGTEVEQVAVDYGRARAAQAGPGTEDGHAAGAGIDPELRAARDRLDGTVFAAMRAAMGGRCTHIICGGASLDGTTEAFFNGIGVRILGAYGLTEAATAVTINEAGASRPGTSGRPIPGTSVAIAADDEVLVSGLNVSPGYWPATAEPDEPAPRWLATGDLGRLDADGFLSITGRRKEILVTNGGKNVSPAPLEDRIRLHSLVSNCMVVAEGRAFVSALVTLDTAAAERWAAARGIGPDHAPWPDLPELLAEVQSAVDDANLMVSRAESVRAFRVLDGDFTVANGQLTPSLKLRRAVVEYAYHGVIAGIYG